MGEWMEQVHMSVPANGPEVTTDDVAKVRRVLERYTNQWVCAKTIAELSGLPATGTCEAVRKACKILLIEQRLPVISGHEGFCYTDDVFHIQHWINNDLLVRQHGLNRTIEAAQKVIDVMLQRDSGSQRKVNGIGSGLCADCGADIPAFELYCKFHKISHSSKKVNSHG